MKSRVPRTNEQRAGIVSASLEVYTRRPHQFSDNLGIVMNAPRPLQLIPLLLFLAGIVLAADVSGKWNFQVNLDAGSGSPTFTFKQDGETLTGAYAGRLGSAKVSGAVNGDRID